jgi:hypothetical protein
MPIGEILPGPKEYIGAIKKVDGRKKQKVKQ